MKLTMRYTLIICCLAGFFVSVYSQDTIWNQFDKKGQKEGWWKKERMRGGLVYKGYFENGHPAGSMIRYYEDGETIKAKMNFDESGSVAYAIIYYNNGEIAAKGKFVNQKKDSLWENYSYYTQKINSIDSYKEGKKHGTSKILYENGTVSEFISYEDGVKHGVWKQYFPSGVLKLQTQYKNGKLEGSYVSYYPNGAVHLKGMYENNKKEGVWEKYNDSKELIDTMTYKEGIPEDLERFEKMEQEQFEKMEEKKGKFDDPSINDLY